MNGHWKEVKVVIPIDIIEPVQGILYLMDVKGLSVEDPNDILLRESGPLSWDFADINLYKEGKDNAVIRAYFPDTDNIEDHINHIKEKIEALKEFGMKVDPYRVEAFDVHEEDWATAWKKYYKPIRIGKNIIIKPTWEEYEKKDGDIIVEMDPGMAFGTGTHETTKMCIEVLEEYIEEGMDVVDVGTGSGILAIVSSKLHANKVTAIDLDPVAVDSAKINRDYNSITNMEVLYGNMTELVSEKADFLIANIIADVIMIIADDVKRIVKPGGLFLASGIINSRLDDVVEKLKSVGLEIIETRNENDWRCVIARVN